MITKQKLRDKLDDFILKHEDDEYELKTINDYKSAVIKFIDYLPNEENELNKKQLIDYKTYLKNEFLVATVNKYIIILNKFLKFIGYKDLALSKIKVQQKTSIDDPIWEQEHKRMLRWAKKLGMNDMYLMIKIFAFTGIRVDELKYFKVENIDNYIKVYNKSKERKIILRDDLKREIKKYCKENKIKSGYIFKSPVKSDKMLNASTIWRRLKKIAGAARINKDKIHAHAWRHLFAKEFMASGGTIDELADILGHSKIETTRIYTMTSNKEKKKKIEKMKF